MRTAAHVEHDAVEVEEHPFAELDVRAVVAEERRLHPDRVAAAGRTARAGSGAVRAASASRVAFRAWHRSRARRRAATSSGSSGSYSSRPASFRAELPFCRRPQPPAMAPMMRNGSVPSATASGSGVSGESCERSSSHAKKRRNGRRICGRVIADRAAQHGVARLQRVEDDALRHRAVDIERRPRRSTAARACAGAPASTTRIMVRQRLHLDRQHRRQVADDRRPTCRRRRPSIDLAAGGAEVDAARIERVDRHRVAQDVHVAVAAAAGRWSAAPTRCRRCGCGRRAACRRAGSAPSRS